MEVQTEQLDSGCVLITVKGEIYAWAAEEFAAQLNREIGEDVKHVIIDCKHLDGVASIGVRILMQIHGRIKANGGGIKLCNVNERLLQMIRVMKLDAVLNVFDTLDEAKAVCKEH